MNSNETLKFSIRAINTFLSLLDELQFLTFTPYLLRRNASINASTILRAANYWKNGMKQSVIPVIIDLDASISTLLHIHEPLFEK